MKKFIDGVIRFRWFIAIIIPLITLTLALQLKNLEFEMSYRVWFDKDAPLLKHYDAFRKIFGNDDGVVVIFKDEKGVFNPKALHVIERITQKLWETEYIARVDSLSNYQYIHTDPEYPDDLLVEPLIEDIDALSEEDLKKKESIALQEDMLVGRLLSKDAKTTMIVARMTPKAGDEVMLPQKLSQLVERIVDDENASGYHFHLSGGPIINNAFIKIAEHDVKLYTPLVLLIVFVILLAIFKRPSAALLSLTVVIFTFLMVLSLQVMMGYKLNNFTANMPVFVVAIGIADAMHLIWVYLLGRNKGLDNHEAIHYSVSKNFLAILFTSLTTSVGFASLAVSHVVPIKTLGIATASAAMLAFVLTILFVPAVLAIVDLKVRKKQGKDKTMSRRFALGYARFIIGNDKRIVAGTTVIFLLLGYGITQVNVDSNMIRYFTQKVPFRQTADFMQKNISGAMSYEIVVDSKRKDGIKDPDFMKTVDQFKKAYQSQFSDIRHISSLVDVVKTFNKVLNGSKTVPSSQELIAQYLLFYSLSLPQGMEINDKMDIDERLLRVSCSVNMVPTSHDLEMIRWAEAWWKDTPYSASVNGQTRLFAHMQHDVTATLINSITIAIVAVSLMMLLIFRNVKLLPLIIAPNILPIVLVIGVMGWLHIDIDIGVAVSGAIIIGVAVDDTIHFLVKYFEARKRGENLHDALAYVMQYAGSAILFTTLILSCAFIIFVFSQFNPNYHFGIITASALLIAVTADLLLLPAIFSLLERRRIVFENV